MAAIPEVQFRSFAEDFIRISTLLKDDWELNTWKGSIFLRKEQIQKAKKSVDIQSEAIFEPVGESVTVLPVEDALEADSACLDVTETADDILKYEYHVIYSESYGVPVLYFNVYRQDGSLVRLDEVWNLIPATYQDRLKEERWTFLTQQEHPYLGRPFYQLHPCHTANLMGQVTSIEQTQERLDRITAEPKLKAYVWVSPQ